MSIKETAQSNGEAPETPNIKVLNQYIRDLSFENIASQKNLSSAEQPAINVGINLDARKRNENNYEVLMKLSVAAESNKEKVFLIEVEYAGIFNITNVPDDQLHPFLMIECPRLLFPFVRQIVRDLAINGGFPPLNIDPIDFVGLYRTELARRTKESETATKN